MSKENGQKKTIGPPPVGTIFGFKFKGEKPIALVLCEQSAAKNPRFFTLKSPLGEVLSGMNPGDTKSYNSPNGIETVTLLKKMAPSTLAKSP